MARISAIDLGKFKSAACLFNTKGGEYAYRTLPPKPADFKDLFTTLVPGRIVVEIGGQAGWIAT